MISFKKVRIYLFIYLFISPVTNNSKFDTYTAKLYAQEFTTIDLATYNLK